MRTLLFSMLPLAMMSLMVSCKGKPCKDVECLNGGVCIESTCKCPDGFSGDRCEIEDPVNKFIGYWYTGATTCTFSSYGYSAISRTGEPSHVRFSPFMDVYYGELIGEVSADGKSLTIPLHTDGYGSSIKASGKFSDTQPPTITWTLEGVRYDWSGAPSPYNCTATWVQD